MMAPPAGGWRGLHQRAAHSPAADIRGTERCAWAAGPHSGNTTQRRPGGALLASRSSSTPCARAMASRGGPLSTQARSLTPPGLADSPRLPVAAYSSAAGVLVASAERDLLEQQGAHKVRSALLGCWAALDVSRAPTLSCRCPRCCSAGTTPAPPAGLPRTQLIRGPEHLSGVIEHCQWCAGHHIPQAHRAFCVARGQPAWQITAGRCSWGRHEAACTATAPHAHLN